MAVKKATEYVCPFEPITDRVIVKTDKKAEVTPGGILLPDTVQKQESCQGTVVAVGPGKPTSDQENIRRDLLIPFKVGDRVLFAKWGGSEVPEHDDLRIFRFDDILAKVR